MFLLVAESLPGASKQGYSLGPVIYTEATQQLQVAMPPLTLPPQHHPRPFSWRAW